MMKSCQVEWRKQGISTMLFGDHFLKPSQPSGNIPFDTAVTKQGYIVYTDPTPTEQTVNIVKNENIETLIKLKKWRPFNICSTSSGDLLVVMQISDDFQQSNIVGCYSGTTKKQTICILFYDRGHGFHSSDNTTKCFTENKNLDICVADSGSNEVLVVNQAGTLRFRYLPTPKNQPFYPAGITTDS
ncbi:uncharacterized protein LOC134263861 [Saccostrea cucullata]|uniref:uncharacterized protein LOC134263861 n=1 Tax=Saccostrea cuccullata TaxID=36930 RepID=UPI002ED56296